MDILELTGKFILSIAIGGVLLSLFMIVKSGFDIKKLIAEVASLPIIYSAEQEKNALAQALEIFEKHCFEIGVPISYHQGTISSNGIQASGTYAWYPKHLPSGKRVFDKVVGIQIAYPNDWMAMTLAHELGHHYGVTLFNDASEDYANQYIKTLCQQLLPEETQKILGLIIFVCSRTEQDIKEGKKYEWPRRCAA